MKRSFITSVFGIVSVLVPFGFGAIASAPAAPIPLEEVSFQVMQEVLNKPEFGQMDKDVFLSYFDFDSQTGMPVSLIPNACLASVAEIENVNEQFGICERFFEKLFETQNNYANRINVSVDELAQSNNLTPDTTKLAQTSDNKYYVANVAMPVDLSHLSPVDQANLKSQPAVFTKRDKFVCAFGDVDGQKLCKKESGSTEYFEYSGGMLSLKDRSSFGGDFYRSVPFGYSALEPLTMEILAAKQLSWSEVGQSYVAMVDASQTQGLSPDALSERQAGRESCMEQFLTEIEQKTGMKPTSDKISVSDDCDLEKCWVDVSYLALKKRCEYPLWGGIGYTEQVGHPSQIAKVEAEAEAQRQREAEQHEAEQRRQHQAEQRRQRQAEQRAEREAENERIRAKRERILSKAGAQKATLLDFNINESYDVLDFVDLRVSCADSDADTELGNGDYINIYQSGPVDLLKGDRRVGSVMGTLVGVNNIRCKCIDEMVDRFVCEDIASTLDWGFGWNVKGAEYCCDNQCWIQNERSSRPTYSINRGGTVHCTGRCPDGTQYEAEHNACLPPLPDVEDELHPAN